MTVPLGVVLGLLLPSVLTLTAITCAFAIGRVARTAFEQMARQPEASPRIQIAMVIGCAFIEALTIYVLLAVLILQGRIAG